MKRTNILLGMMCMFSMIACTEKNTVKTAAEKEQKSTLMVESKQASLALASNGETKSIENNEAKKPVVFISGYDEDSNKYYTKAKAHFSSKNYTIVENVYSIAQIIHWLNTNANENPYGEIHVVSQSNSWNGMSLKDTNRGSIITDSSLKKALLNKTIPALKPVLSKNAKLIIHACGLGNDTVLLETLKEAFTANVSPSLYASSLFSVFGSEFSEHYLAKAHYGYYPTANSPGKIDLAKEFKRNYPDVDLNWLNVLKKKSEQYIGGVFTYQFNIPVEWKIPFESKQDIPNFKTEADLMNFMSENKKIAAELTALKIPIHKFRWNERTLGNNLIIEGMVTVVSVLIPEMSLESPVEYMAPDLDNKDLYKVF